MANANYPETRIHVDADLNPVDTARIQAIDTEIHRQPETFRKLLAALGDTAAFNEVKQPVIPAPRREAVARAMIGEFFANRYDIKSSFDDATETAISQNDAHRVLIDQLKSYVPHDVKLGTMKKGTSFDATGAEHARNMVRHSRLSLYAARVALTKSATKPRRARRQNQSAS